MSISSWFKNHFDVLESLLCGFFVILSYLLLESNLLGLALLALPIAYVIGGYNSTKEGLHTLLSEREFDVDLLMIIAALGSAALGIWRKEYYLILDGAILILIFSISGALESFAMANTDKSIKALMSLTSDQARMMINGQEQMRAVNSLEIGDQVLVKAGELIPTDGLIIEGQSSLNESAITGESIPVWKTIGDEVFAGTLNGKGALRLEIHKKAESNLIQRIVRLVENAQSQTPPSQAFIEKFEKSYAQVIILVGLLLATLPPFLLNWSWENTIYRALVFLVVASPCALMAAIMPTLLSAIANGAREGILFKNGAQLEMIAKVKAIAFDKTGTLTLGQLKVVQILPNNQEQDPTNLLKIASALEVYSEHPIGEAIVQYARQKGINWPSASKVQSEVGAGIIGEVEGQRAIVGNMSFVKEQLSNLNWENPQQTELTTVWVAHGDRLLGSIGLADTIKPEAASAIAHLKKMGIEHFALLTGDNPATARAIANEVGISDVYAELMPENKLEIIESLLRRYGTVAMVGDGINDAPALAKASVGIAMGAAGSDVALESADIILISDNLEKLEEAIGLGRRSQAVVKQNIIFALSFIALLLIANFTRGISLPLGVFGHEGSTVLVTLSGLRLLFRR